MNSNRLIYNFACFFATIVAVAAIDAQEQNNTKKIAPITLKAMKTIDRQQKLPYIEHARYGNVVNQPLLKLQPPVIQFIDPIYRRLGLIPRSTYLHIGEKNRALVCATTIKSLIEQDIIITEKNFKNYSLKCEKQFCSQPNLSPVAKLTDYYALTLHESHIEGTFHTQQHKEPFSILHLQHQLRTQQSKDRWCLPLICTLKHKTVLLCLAKETDQNPMIFYVDTINGILDVHTPEYDLVSMIHDRCFAKNFLQKLASMAFLQPLNFFKKS